MGFAILNIETWIFVQLGKYVKVLVNADVRSPRKSKKFEINFLNEINFSLPVSL